MSGDRTQLDGRKGEGTRGGDCETIIAVLEWCLTLYYTI